MNKRNYSIDFIRIVATTCILFHHYQLGTGAVFKYINFWGGSFYFGNLVELFFVISGFFCFHHVEQIKDGITMLQFLKKKYQRILPLVAISVFVESFLCLYNNVYLLGGDFGFNLWDVVKNTLGIQNGWFGTGKSINGPTWYISVLLLCYVVFAFLVFTGKHIQIPVKYMFLGMIALGVVIRTYSISYPFLNTVAARGYIAFFVGVLLKQYINSNEYQKSMEWKTLLLLILFLCGCAICPEFINKYIYYILVFVIYPAFLVVSQMDICYKVFNHKWIGMLGIISFNTYIWHEPLTVFRAIIINKTGIDMNLNSLGSMIRFAGNSWIVGALSYFFIEKAIITIINKKKYKNEE